MAISDININKKLQAVQPYLIMLVVLPWNIWITGFISFLLYSIQNPTLVAPSIDRTYCALQATSVKKAVPIFCTVLGFLNLCTEIVIVTLTYKHRKLISRSGRSMAIRAAVFTVTVGFCTGLAGVYSMKKRPGFEFDLTLAVLPPITALIFGTQVDLFFALLPVSKERLELWMTSTLSSREADNETLPGDTALPSKMVMSRSIDSESFRSSTSTLEAGILSVPRSRFSV